jgi:AraC family transcriptional regulator
MNSHDFVELESCRVSAEAFAEQPASIPEQSNSCAEGRWETRFPLAAAEILDDVRRAMEWNPDHAHALALRLVALLTPPAGVASAGARGGLAPWQKRKVDRYLSEHLGRPLYIKEIASQVSLSVSHFCRAFRESHGTTPHKHILRLRLELAQRLMLTSEDSLSQIALACGMADQSHLSRLFRRGVGETPAAWLRRSLPDAEAEARSRRPKASRFASLPT